MMAITSKKPLPVEPPTEAQIRTLLESSDAAVEEGILRLHARQTTDEQRSKDTKHKNCSGFSAAHAKKGSKYADWILGMRRDHKAKPGQGLRRADHKAQARQLILHYVRQLHEEAAAKWTAAAAAVSQAPFDADEAEETEMIQQADRDDSERAAQGKLARDQEAERTYGITPGSMVQMLANASAWSALNSAQSITLPKGTSGLVITSPQTFPMRKSVTRVLFGSRALWVMTADVGVVK